MADTERTGELVRDRAAGFVRDLLQVDEETDSGEESERRNDGGCCDGRRQEGRQWAPTLQQSCG